MVVTRNVMTSVTISCSWHSMTLKCHTPNVTAQNIANYRLPCNQTLDFPHCCFGEKIIFVIYQYSWPLKYILNTLCIVVKSDIYQPWWFYWTLEKFFFVVLSEDVNNLCNWESDVEINCIYVVRSVTTTFKRAFCHQGLCLVVVKPKCCCQLLKSKCLQTLAKDYLLPGNVLRLPWQVDVVIFCNSINNITRKMKWRLVDQCTCW